MGDLSWGDNKVVHEFSYLSTSEIWPDKRDQSLWELPYKRGGGGGGGGDTV